MNDSPTSDATSDPIPPGQPTETRSKSFAGVTTLQFSYQVSWKLGLAPAAMRLKVELPLYASSRLLGSSH